MNTDIYLTPESMLDLAAETALGQNRVLRVTGNAFAAEYIVAGDYLILRPGEEHAEVGDLVLATLDGEKVVGTLTRERGQLWIVSREPLVPPRLFAAGVDDIEGVVVAVVRQTKRAA